MAIPRVSPQDDFSKMFHAKMWTGTVTIECMQTAKEESTTLTVKRSFGFSVSLGSRQAVGGDTTPRCYWTDVGSSTVEGTVEDKLVEIGLEGEVAAIDTITGKVAGPFKWGPIQLAMNPQDKTYRLVVNPVYFNERHVRKIYNNGQETVDIDYDLPGMSGSPLVEIVKPLPTTGTTLTGSAVIKEDFGGEINRGLIEKLSYTVKWTLNPGGPPPDFVIDKSSFERYIPNDDSGNVTIRSTKPDAAPALVRVTISGISQEPGTCINSPDDALSPDLEVLASDNPEFESPTADLGTIKLQTKKEVRQATLSIRCKDYGAYGTLRAEAKIKGEWKPIKLSSSEATSVQFPLDENNNHVADPWEVREGIRPKNLPETWDGEDKPKLDGSVGDGLTLYEEYRGAIVNGSHNRLSPARKKLFVNATLAQAFPGVALFEQATQLEVVRVSSQELLDNPQKPADRSIVNRRFATAHGGFQHGIRIVSGGAAASGSAVVGGETIPLTAGAKRTRSPGEVKEVRMPEYTQADRDSFGPAAINRDVAHELGHCLGAIHHGDASPQIPERTITSTMNPQPKVYAADGTTILQRPFQLKGQLGGPQCEASGDISCFMAYTGVYSWSVYRDGANWTFLNVGETPPGTHFCTSGVGTGINQPKHKPLPVFGNAQPGKGNCLAKLRVKDW